MTLWQGIVSIILAIIAGISGTITFFVKRKDDMKEKDINKLIEDAVTEAKAEVYKELAKVSQERSQEGADRFNTHAEAIKQVNRQIEKNNEQIERLTEISTNVLESMESLGKVVKASAESQKNANYDRLLIVGKKILKVKQITLSEKTNLKQLYDSYKELQGMDPYIETLFEECMKLVPIPDDEKEMRDES